MTDLPSALATLRRPRLLISAARYGLPEYRRERDLARLLQGSRPTSSMDALWRLMDLEEETDQLRRSGSARYAVGKHIELLIAVMAEAKMLTAMRREERVDNGLEKKAA
ncbi:hypothetical protein RGUI_0135 [Rhodovulum sp. P5]|uniref:DUF6477 family protein n=1 Tax=Rhodovulum sp. P5 TaxID=1564506 RepID=UPI0009C277A1|nr:DUF6477 family protein [Rhodovulum sp. P5]ARE38276.1 hypothetical protein RGUI_0135 [Rhodovulum sp. P5]